MGERGSWNLKLTETAKLAQNPMRMLYEISPPVFKGDPSLSKINLQPGDPNIYGNHPPHPEILKALSDAVQKDTFMYYENPGLKVAREAVVSLCSHLEGISSDDILLTSGGTMAIEMSVRVLADPGDNILIPRPCYVYPPLIKQYRIDVKHYDLDINRDWEINLEHLESLIDSRTRAILVNNPGNPCGND